MRKINATIMDPHNWVEVFGNLGISLSVFTERDI